MYQTMSNFSGLGDTSTNPQDHTACMCEPYDVAHPALIFPHGISGTMLIVWPADWQLRPRDWHILPKSGFVHQIQHRSPYDAYIDPH